MRIVLFSKVKALLKESAMRAIGHSEDCSNPRDLCVPLNATRMHQIEERLRRDPKIRYFLLLKFSGGIP